MSREARIFLVDASSQAGVDHFAVAVSLFIGVEQVEVSTDDILFGVVDVCDCTIGCDGFDDGDMCPGIIEFFVSVDVICSVPEDDIANSRDFALVECIDMFGISIDPCDSIEFSGARCDHLVAKVGVYKGDEARAIVAEGPALEEEGGFLFEVALCERDKSHTKLEHTWIRSNAR